MNIRQTINMYPAASAGATAGILMICALVFLFSSNGRTPIVEGASQSYFSDDGGKTYFTDDASKVPPFEHDGKTACYAGVFEFDDGRPFVAYLLRYTPDGKAKLEHFSLNQRNSSDPRVNAIKQNSREVQRPGDKRWIRSDSIDFDGCLEPQRPSGTKGIAVELHPHA